MAIKERKQITGTTEQINAYAGHEGQIVWDKNKKTLVGMSGTAGTNYPLAQQAYVDEGLAGKEDKGTCLPLTGGNITGKLQLKFGGLLYQSRDPVNTYGYTVLTSKGDGDLNSCSLYLANPDSADEGLILLRYLDGSGGNHDFVINGKNDDLRWNGNAVECISDFGSNHIRYANGLQIVYDAIGNASKNGGTRTFSAPFSVAPVALATHLGSEGSVNIVAECSTTAVTLRTNWNTPVSAYFIVIGRWK